MDSEEKLNKVLSEKKDNMEKQEFSTSDLNEVSTERDKEPVSDPEESIEQKFITSSFKSATNSSSEDEPNMIVAFLKSKLGIYVSVSILILAVLVFVLIKKYTNEKSYEKHLKEFVTEAETSSIASAYICDDLRKVWQEYIFDDKEFFNQADGTFSKYYSDDYEYCSNFSEAVNRKIRWNEDHLSSGLNDSYLTAKRLYKEMTPPPSKYKDIHTYVKQMFKAMERLHELSVNPEGNFSSYSSDCNTTANEFTSALSDLTNESDIDF